MDYGRSSSADQGIRSRELLLARAQQLLTKPTKESGVHQFEPYTIKNIKREMDKQVAKIKAETRAHIINEQENEAPKPKQNQIVSTLIQPSEADPSPVDQTCPAIVGNDLNASMMFNGIDDGVLSMRSFDLGKPRANGANRFNRGSANVIVNANEDRFSDIPDGVDMSMNILITYFLHALEIERLVTVNKELVLEGQDMEQELETLDVKIETLETENKTLKTKLETTGSEIKVGAPLQKGTPGVVPPLNMNSSGQQYANEQTPFPTDRSSTTKNQEEKEAISLKKLQQELSELEAKVRKEERSRNQEVISKMQEDYNSHVKGLEKKLVESLRKVEDLMKERKKGLIDNIQNIVESDAMSIVSGRSGGSGKLPLPFGPTPIIPSNNGSGEKPLYSSIPEHGRKSSDSSAGFYNVYAANQQQQRTITPQVSQFSTPPQQYSSAVDPQPQQIASQPGGVVIKIQPSVPIRIGNLSPRIDDPNQASEVAAAYKLNNAWVSQQKPTTLSNSPDNLGNSIAAASSNTNTPQGSLQVKINPTQISTSMNQPQQSSVVNVFQSPSNQPITLPQRQSINVPSGTTYQGQTLQRTSNPPFIQTIQSQQVGTIQQPLNQSIQLNNSQYQPIERTSLLQNPRAILYSQSGPRVSKQDDDSDRMSVASRPTVLERGSNKPSGYNPGCYRPLSLSGKKPLRDNSIDSTSVIQKEKWDAAQSNSFQQRLESIAHNSNAFASQAQAPSSVVNVPVSQSQGIIRSPITQTDQNRPIVSQLQTGQNNFVSSIHRPTVSHDISPIVIRSIRANQPVSYSSVNTLPYQRSETNQTNTSSLNLPAEPQSSKPQPQQGQHIVQRSANPNAVHITPTVSLIVDQKPASSQQNIQNNQPSSTAAEVKEKRRVYDQGVLKEFISENSDTQSVSRTGTGFGGSVFQHGFQRLNTDVTSGARSVILGPRSVVGVGSSGVFSKGVVQRMSKEYTPVLANNPATRVSFNS
jgi:hypothetical protein